ncbi:MAG: TonB family protein [Hyphomonadaceae bacterium]
MKLLHVTLGLAASCVMPIAAAVAEPQTSDARPYAIEVSSGVQPVSAEEVRYPSGAAMRRQNGSCSLQFDVTADGDAQDVRVLACSSADFRKEALRATRDFSFDSAAQDAVMTIRWTISPPVSGEIAGDLH